MVVPPAVVVDNTSDATSAPCSSRRSKVGSRLVPADDSASYSGRRLPARRRLREAREATASEITLGLYGHLMRGNEREAVTLIDTFLRDTDRALLDARIA
jgi:hypothetical protein